MRGGNSTIGENVKSKIRKGDSHRFERLEHGKYLGYQWHSSRCCGYKDKYDTVSVLKFSLNNPLIQHEMCKNQKLKTQIRLSKMNDCIPQGRIRQEFTGCQSDELSSMTNSNDLAEQRWVSTVSAKYEGETQHRRELVFYLWTKYHHTLGWKVKTPMCSLAHSMGRV